MPNIHSKPRFIQLRGTALPIVAILAVALTTPTIAAGHSRAETLLVIDQSGVDGNFELLVKTYAERTTSAAASYAACGDARYNEVLEAAILAEKQNRKEEWRDAQAHLLEDNLTPAEIHAAVGLPAQQTRQKTFGRIDPNKLQTSLETRIQPIVEKAVVQIVSQLTEQCM